MKKGRVYLPVLILLLAGSGCAALIYEVIWFQLLQLVIGSSGVSLGLLLAAYMGGLCAGSILLPRFVSPRIPPLKVYAALELGIGILGLLVLIAVPIVGPGIGVELLVPVVPRGGSVELLRTALGDHGDRGCSRHALLRIRRGRRDIHNLDRLSRSHVTDVVRQQVEAGIDIVTDGEQGKSSFYGYVGCAPTEIIDLWDFKNIDQALSS